MAASTLEKLSSNKAFEGELIKYKYKVGINRSARVNAFLIQLPPLAFSHPSILKSDTLGGLYTNFNIYLPPNATRGNVPLLWYLSGLTCTEDNACVGTHILLKF